MAATRGSAFDPAGYDEVCDIGRGAFGMCTLYVHKETGFLRVVKKAIADYGPGDEKNLERFGREVEILHREQHPTIVNAFGYGVPLHNEFRAWLEMDFVPGGTVYELVHDNVQPDGQLTLDPTDVLIVLFGVAYGLGFLHYREVVHRDIKPSNIVLDHRGEPRLADFGLARSTDPAGRISLPLTPNYAAPEVIRGDDIPQAEQAKRDVWSFGMLLWEVRTGKIPFAECNGVDADIMTKITQGDLPRLPDTDPFAEIYRKCVTMDYAARPGILEIAGDLDNLVVDDVDTARWHEYRERIQTFDQMKYPLPIEGTIENLIAAAENRAESERMLASVYASSRQYRNRAEATRRYVHAWEFGCLRAATDALQLENEGKIDPLEDGEREAMIESIKSSQF